jgi:hypothetical protein
LTLLLLTTLMSLLTLQQHLTLLLLTALMSLLTLQ